MTNLHNPNQPENHADLSDGNSRTASLRAANTQALATAIVTMMRSMIRPPLFPLGQIVVTPGAIDLLDRFGINASDLLSRHQRGDWGVVSTEDATENMRAIQDGNRMLSAYAFGPHKEMVWLLTEHDCSATTIMLPSEY